MKLKSGIVPVGLQFLNLKPTANVITQLIAPSANVGGLIIRTMTLAMQSSSSGDGINIYADTAAPSSISDFSKREVFEHSGQNGYSSATLPYEMYVYPGMGVWVATSCTNATVIFSYDFVSPDACCC